MKAYCMYNLNPFTGSTGTLIFDRKSIMLDFMDECSGRSSALCLLGYPTS
jgi:hypothetical protein